MSKHVTIIEDDPDVRAILQRSLMADGYLVTALETGLGYDAAAPADLFIVDVGLPDIDGLTLTQQIRRSSDAGIIIVSGRGDLTDRVVGLELGADDYVTKPFEPREIIARVRSVLRRGGRGAQTVAVPVPARVEQTIDRTAYDFNGWTLDTLAQSVSGGDGAIVLTSGEYKLLETLVTHANRVLTRDQLMDYCHGSNSPAFDRSIDVCVGRLRKKLNDDPKNPQLIKTVRNGGYIFVARVTRH
jgi:two-component system OmpR family response regulator